MVFQDQKRKWHYFEDVDPLDQKEFNNGFNELRLPLILALVYVIYAFSSL